jgi:hypothetical protein
MTMDQNNAGWIKIMLDFTRKFPPWKSGIKASKVPSCWLNTAGHLEEKFHRQNVAESHQLLFFR